MKTIGEALRELVPCFEPVGSARVALLDSLDKALAEDVVADRDLPGFDNSAMDGYAVRHAELRPGRALRVAAESRAGGGVPAPLAPGTAARIFTGAPLPAGADTVVIQENATRAGDDVTFDPLPSAAANVRARASDLAKGALALRKGTSIGPGEIGLLAAIGRHHVSVYRSPRVAIVSVGDELRDIGMDHEPGTVPSSNAYMLASMVRALGGDPWLLPIAPDRLDAIAATLQQALRADVVLSSGGVSVGEYDLMARAFAAAGVQERFAKVAIKPGKPLWFGLQGRVPVVGLPGNPVSALVTFELFVHPALRRMLGHAAPYPALIDVRLEHDHRHGVGRVELARARLHTGAHGELHARLHSLQGSGSLPSIVDVDALVVLDAHTERFAAGARLPAVPLRARQYRDTPAFQ